VSGNQTTLTFGGDASSLQRAANQATASIGAVSDEATRNSRELSNASASGQDMGGKLAKLSVIAGGVGNAFQSLGGLVSDLADFQNRDKQKALDHARALQTLKEAILEAEQSALDLVSAQQNLVQTDIDARRAQIAVSQATIDAASAQEDYRQTIVDGKQAQLSAIQATQDAAQAQEDYKQSVLDGEQAQKDLNQAVLDGKQAQANIAQSQIDASQASLNAEKAQQDYNTAVQKHGESSIEARQALIDIAQAQQDVTQAQLDGEQAQQDVAQASQDAAQAQLDMTQSVLDGKQANIDMKTAALDGEQAQRDLARSVIDGRQAQLDMNTAELDGEQAQLDLAKAALAQKQALLDLSKQIEAAKDKQLDLLEAQMKANVSPLKKAADEIGYYSQIVGDAAIVVGGLALAYTAVKDSAILASVWTKVAAGAQWLFNAAMDASPIGIVVLAVGALVAAIVLIATKTTWFQDIWKVSWAWIKDAAGAAWDFIKAKASSFWEFLKGIPDSIGRTFSSISDGISAPFKAAFNLVSDAWNNTVGKLSWSVPGWVPSIGGNTISAPKLPKFHTGGTVPGAPGTEMLAVLQAGETVVPNGGSQPIQIVLKSDGGQIGNFLMAVLNESISIRGNSIETVIGSAV